MEIEFEDDEVGDKRVCRLCGKTQRLYIDVFGEEGTKRFVGTKIHSKINIMIDESDPLPKTICVQCLGKLEFVCDFQEECLRTQQLLRDQYSLPPLLNTDEITPDELVPSTSTIPKTRGSNSKNVVMKNNVCAVKKSLLNHEVKNMISYHISNNNNNNNNNNNSPKNFNPRNSLIAAENQIYKNKRKKNVRVQQTTSNALQQPEITSTRKLRSSATIEIFDSDTNNTSAKRAMIIKKRLKNNISYTGAKINSNPIMNLAQGLEKKTAGDKNNTIQIATNTLNKVLTAITNAPGIGVSVKESSHSNNDSEDISFTVELSKKQETNSFTVLAKVFPEHDSCLVDKSIITFLEGETNERVNNLVNNISTPIDSKDKNINIIDILQNADDISISAKNPEELYKMDGKEIHVDENVEQVNINNQVNYKCKLCKKSYERKDKCTVHVKTHLGIKQYMCILCQSKFVCKSDVMKHIRCSHTNPRPISCSKCPKRFRSKFDLTEHMNVHKGIKPYQCADCDQSYHHKVSLQMHVKSHMPPQNLACEYCGKVFPYRTRLLSHVGSVHMKDKRNFRCRFCYNLYSSLTVLNDHIKTRHTTTYTCETCGKTFKVASKYKTHVLQHSNPKPYVCNICKKNYASKAFLNEHLLKHQGVRKHICQKCGAAFAQASHLAAHRHVHGEKNYACPECGKLFNRRDNMKVHRKRHLISNDKPNESQKIFNYNNIALQ